MICSCCGYEVNENSHPVNGGKKIVCDRCWNNTDLFFPEKLQDDSRLKLLSKLANEDRLQPDFIRVQVIRLTQKGLEMYIGKLTAKDLIKLSDVNKFEEKELTGYQREVYRERTSDLVEYLDKCPVAVMPGIFVSIRNAKFIPQSGDVGILEIFNKKGSIWIIDGQHRIGGFERVRNKFVFEENTTISPDLFSSLMNYEIPIVFVNSKQLAQKISSSKRKSEQTIEAEDLERAMFFIVNKTQKGINPSLKDALLYRINIGGIDGIPALRKEKWRINGASIAISLNHDAESPLKELINVSGKRLQGKPVQLNSFVSSLEKLLRDTTFTSLGISEQLLFVRTFWTVLSRILPQAFDLETSKDYMVLKALGLHCIHLIAYDILKKCIDESLDCFEEAVLSKMLEPLKSFDWTTQTSPLSSLGGMKGVKEAYRILTEALNSKSSEDYLSQTKIPKLNSFIKQRTN
ncbi:MAG: DGQHR domain-containing protein [Candidatus Bathyarchaeota archaeon]